MIIYIDITNYVVTRAHTGIQRVVREFLRRLNSENHSFDYKVIFNDCHPFEFNIISGKELCAFLADPKDYTFSYNFQKITIDEFEKKDIFFDIDGAWSNGLKRSYLYSRLKEKEVKIINFIYDLVPVVLPIFSHIDTVRNFTMYLYAVYEYSDLVFFDSRSAEKDFFKIKDEILNKRSISTRVVKLGADISEVFDTVDNHVDIKCKKYILFVGTIEPRKNQRLLLQVFEELVKIHDDLSLVFVGRGGWNNDALINDIKNHSLINSKIFWPQNISDAELMQYYKNAYINVYLSEYEGFGLPIAESLAHGAITVTSKNSSMYEVGKNFADYVSYNSKNELFDILNLYLSNDEIYKRKKEYIISKYLPYTWDLMYQSVVSVFDGLSDYAPVAPPLKLQFVFISIDVEKLKGTIESIDKYIDFVSEYIVVTRGDLLDAFSEIESKYEIIIINENDILGDYAKDFSKRDHQSKNWLLRASLLNLDNLDCQFIMLDDDNRPLKKVEMDHFIKSDKYNAYYFYDLLFWESFVTDYDLGQSNTRDVLDKDGFELLSYSSHKPQIIDKRIFQEVVEKYFDIGLRQPIDEWSVYFNYAISKYPYLFNKLKYDTLSWPGSYSDWNLAYVPDEYNFENYYSSNFQASLIEKLQANKLALEAYLETHSSIEEIIGEYKRYNIVHGVLAFNSPKGELYVLNVPYVLKAKQKTWVKLSLNYKALFLNECKVELMYYINGKKGAFTRLSTDDEITDCIVSFGISCESLPQGEFSLLVDAVVDGVPVYGGDSPYLVKLIVE